MTAPDRLRDELSRLADEAVPVDLYTRVMRTSRSLRRRRIAGAASALSAVLLVVAVGAGVATRRDAAVQRPPGSGTTSPAPSRSPGPGTSMVPQTAPSIAPGYVPDLTIYYAVFGDGDAIRLKSWQPGKGQPRDLRSVTLLVPYGVDVSPDGQSVAWIDGGGLKVARLTGGTQRTVLATAPQRCVPAQWAPDSVHILVGKADGGAGYVHTDGGSVASLPGPTGCGARVSRNGRWVAWTDLSTRQLLLADTNGGQPRAVPRIGGQNEPTVLDVESVSPAGDLLAVRLATPPSAEGQGPGRLAVVAVANGEELAYVPQDIRKAWFLADGRLLLDIATDELVLVDTRGYVVWRGPGPTAFTGTIIGVR